MFATVCAVLLERWVNRNSSGIVVKVDFDLVMTLLAHNLYRLFAYRH